MVKATQQNPSENATANLTNVSNRVHRATYSRDKKTPGQYLIRVVGPHATEFEGRIIPVTRNDGSETNETLLRPIASGIDDGQVSPSDKGKTWCLYKMVQKPKQEKVLAEF